MGKRCDEEWGREQFGDAGWILLDRYRGASVSHRVECTTCGNQSTKKLERAKRGKGCVSCYRTGPGTRIPDDVAYERMVKAGFTPKDREHPGILSKWLSTCNVCGGEVWVTLNHAEAVGIAACPHICRTRRKEERKATTAARKAARKEDECQARAERRKAKRKAQEPDAAEFMLTRGYRPAEDFPGPEEPWKLTCETCGELFVTTLKYQRMGKPPKGCHVQGYDSIRPAYVYVIEHLATGALKPGFTADVDKRMKQFPGWRLVGFVETVHGGEAFCVEQETLRIFREEGYAPYFTKEDGIGSPTESIPPGVVSPEALLDAVRALAAGKRVRLAPATVSRN